MLNKKKLLITTIILGAMFPICAFGLSFITEAFLIVGMYCGISAMFCVIILMDLKAGQKPSLIPVGLCMACVGFAFLCFSDFYQIVTIPLSALYAVAGLLILAKGIKDWHDGKRRRAPRMKKPMNKNIYVGIGLIVGGFFATIILFNILPLLMSIGHVMVVVGFVVLGHGIAKIKNSPGVVKPAVNNISTKNKTNTSTTTAEVTTTSNPTTSSTKQVENEYCARCGKNITYLPNAQVFNIEGRKYCSGCKNALDQDMKNQHLLCSVCGIDLPIENMHVIDDVLLCHSCFLKKYGSLDFYEEEEDAFNTDDAVSSLRKKIIVEITKTPAVKYQLARLLWQDAATCFPKSAFQWDGAWFNLDLQTGKLSAEVSTYPNQLGACREDYIPLSASEFNSIANQFNMGKELQAFKSDKDWTKLFDDSLKSAVFLAAEILKKNEAERKNE